MCEPITMTVLMLAAAGTTMYGQKQAGDAAEAAGEFNAEMKEQQAESVGEQASFEARQLANENRRQVAKGIASAAGSGVSSTSGSILDWESDMQTAHGTDLAALEHNTATTQRGLRLGAELDRVGGRNAKKASRTQMLSTAFGAGASIAGGWGSFAKAGGGGSSSARAATANTNRSANASIFSKFG